MASSSNYETHGGLLRNCTMDAWQRISGPMQGSCHDRLTFWMTYLRDVAPREVSICHVPDNEQALDLSPPHVRTFERVEIQLRCPEGILMTGLVSRELSHVQIEQVTAAVAYDHWCDGVLVQDPQQVWGMFHCLANITFHVSLDGRNYVNGRTLHPIIDADEISDYLWQEYSRIRRH